MKRPFSYYLLIFLLLFQSFSAFYGAYILLYDTESKEAMIASMNLQGPPFGSFLIPGFILLFVLELPPENLFSFYHYQ